MKDRRHITSKLNVNKAQAGAARKWRLWQIECNSRFWLRVKQTKPDECWEWQMSFGGHGYGQIVINGQHYLTHRMAYQLSHGPIPKGYDVCHKCDNKRCCNPRHLFVGTRQDNIRDCMRKVRFKYLESKFGEENNAATLTSKKVKEIRKAITNGNTQTAIANSFGVSRHAVYCIKVGKTWSHLL